MSSPQTQRTLQTLIGISSCFNNSLMVIPCHTYMNYGGNPPVLPIPHNLPLIHVINVMSMYGYVHVSV